MEEIVEDSVVIVMLVLMIRGHIVILIWVDRLGKVRLYKHWVDHSTLEHCFDWRCRRQRCRSLLESRGVILDNAGLLSH